MAHRHEAVLAGARRAVSLVQDLVNVVREVSEWRHERDAFVAMYMDEVRRRDRRDEGHGRDLHGRDPFGAPRPPKDRKLS